MTTIRQCARCGALKANGRQCTLNTCKLGPYCWIHTWGIMHLKVSPSTIAGAGLGLFADCRDQRLLERNNDVVFRKNAFICEYDGDHLTKEQFDRRYPRKKSRAPYVIKAKNNLYVDSIKSNQGLGRYANDCKRAKCNAKFSINHRGGTKVSLRAERNIKQGEEIMVPYGQEYWKYGI